MGASLRTEEGRQTHKREKRENRELGREGRKEGES